MKFAVAALIATASARDFPWFSPFHAHCELTLTVANTECADVMLALENTMIAWSAGGPAKGIYTNVAQSESSTWYTRTTPVKKYVDDIMFDATIYNGIDCNVVAKSQSQSLSYYDYDTNYCNMYNVFRKSGLKYGTITPSQCKWVPTDADTTCDKY